ncbi:hypothetical protein HYU13_01565, partial [Candidatus Woesearchaeota archaeon]|nr:hypothetical protein [Candidatus Woesearchaeota archaeon]
MELKKNINKLVLINIIGAAVVVFLIFKGGKVGIKGDIDISGIVMLIVLSILSMVSSFISSFWFKATIEKVKALFLSNLGILISSWF